MVDVKAITSDIEKELALLGDLVAQATTSLTLPRVPFVALSFVGQTVQQY